MPNVEEYTDVVVIGAGHAGCEAGLACARLGLDTVVFTVSVDSIALMPCNPNIGGSSIDTAVGHAFCKPLHIRPDAPHKIKTGASVADSQNAVPLFFHKPG